MSVSQERSRERPGRPTHHVPRGKGKEGRYEPTWPGETSALGPGILRRTPDIYNNRNSVFSAFSCRRRRRQASIHFRRAIERRALWMAEDAARELPSLPLETALQLVKLDAEKDRRSTRGRRCGGFERCHIFTSHTLALGEATPAEGLAATAPLQPFLAEEVLSTPPRK